MSEMGAFDIIGDIHGKASKLRALRSFLDKDGHAWHEARTRWWLPDPPSMGELATGVRPPPGLLR